MTREYNNIIKNDLFSLPNDQFNCVGTGFISIDAVYPGNTNKIPYYFAGGSCGNVMAILSYLGLDCYPLARLSNDEFSSGLIKDLASWGVNTDFLTKSDSGSTPIVVETIIGEKHDKIDHLFRIKCPKCHSWLPGYRAILLKDVESIVGGLPKTDVFYFDRSAPSSLKFAKYFKNKGALVFFEPSSFKEDKNFDECIRISDIVKFAAEKIGNESNLIRERKVPLIIQTCGSKGINYSLFGSDWNSQPAFSIETISDSAGSGDWFSAGVIFQLSKDMKKGIGDINMVRLNDIFRFAQSLAVLNCCFESPRESMYRLEKKDFKRLIQKTFQMQKCAINHQ